MAQVEFCPQCKSLVVKGSCTNARCNKCTTLNLNSYDSLPRCKFCGEVVFPNTGTRVSKRGRGNSYYMCDNCAITKKEEDDD